MPDGGDADGARRDGLDGAAREAVDRKIVRQSGWVAISYGSGTLLSMASMLALVRLLDPKAFGLLALATVFVAVLGHLQESGLGAAVIQRREEVPEAAGTAVVASALTGTAVAAALAALAPVAESLLRAPGLTGILRGLAPMLAIRGLAVVPLALLERKLDYKGTAKAQLSAAVAQPAIAVGLAVAGAGVWSLVAGQVAASALLAVVVWAIVPWRPDPRLARWSTFRSLVRYGRFVSGANVVNLLNNTLDNVTVGRLLGTRALGFYAITWRLADMPNTVIGNIVGRVLFPVYSALHRDREEVARIYLQNLQRVALLALPVSAAMAAAAEPIVRGLLGPGWLPVVWPLRILALYGAVKAMCAPSGEVFKGVGRPQLALLFGGTHTVLVVPALIALTLPFGLNGAATALLIVVCASGLPALATSLRVLDVTAGRALRALSGPIACAVAVAGTLLAATSVVETLQAQVALAAVVAAGVAVYAAAVALLARPIVTPVVASFRRERKAAVAAAGEPDESFRPSPVGAGAGGNGSV